MIEFPITLTSGGSVCLPGHAFALALGYTKNRGVYQLNVTASGEWQGLIIRAFWHLPGGGAPASTLVVDGYVAVPASVTAQPGNGCITFEGSDGTRTVTSADLRYRVSANSGTEDGTMPEPGTPAWQELVGAVKSDAAAVQQAAQAAVGAADRSAKAASKAEAAAGRAERAQKAAESAKADALDAIGTSKQDALDAVQQAQNGAVKAVTDTQTTATKAVQTAQSTATGAVTKAQTTATAAVEKKGEEVLATIPEDYTNILARVAALESCGFVVVNGKVCMKYVKT
ncbi:MAG: hypothetical protein U0M85_07375 [Gemmiger sp.]